MPLQATSGAASYDGFGGGVVAEPNYIESCFSTYLYTGNGSTQTITNGIDLSTKGGLVWIKDRTTGGQQHNLIDTVRGPTNRLSSNSTGASSNDGGSPSFNSNGFTVVANSSGYTNLDDNFVSWTFREQPKFFDVVTYTGNGAAARAISHNLGSTPGCMIVKRTDAAGDWRVYHRGCSTDNGLVLNDTAAQTTSAIYWFGNEVNVIPPTSTQFTVNAGFTNTNGGTYVAYLFAHDAGGFGLTGTDNVISCGSYTTDGSGNATINLGYEPQWLLVKNTSAPASWIVVDNMRGFGSATDSTNRLNPNTSGAEITGSTPYYVTSTGFTAESGPSVNFIYIAIRRGPMKVPTLGTSVFGLSARTGTGATGSSTSFGQVTDLTVIKQRSSTQTWAWTDRLRGATQELTSAATTVATAFANDVTGFDTMTGFTFGTGASGQVNTSAATYSDLLFKRAPGFFDEVCYTGTGAGTLVNHNLAVKPELIIYKSRSAVDDWPVNYTTNSSFYYYLYLNTTVASSPIGVDTDMTSTTITPFRDGSGVTYVAYLFATCAGVSKVFSYTGNGSSQTINCGFTAGSRFVLIKRTDAAGDWYVWDSARGIVAGNDPHLSLNTTAAEVTTDDSVDTDNTGFIVNQVAATNVNVSSATYIGLAVA